MSRRQAVVLLDAVESLGAQLMHALSLAGGYRITALALTGDNALRHSWRCRFVLRPDWRWDAGAEQLDGLGRPGGAILLPVTAEAVAWTVRHRAALAPRWRLPLLPPAAALAIARDKAALTAFAAAHAVPVPWTATPDRDGVLASSPSFPVLVKPRRGGGGDGIARCDSPAALRARLAALRDPTAYQVQRYLDGEDVNCGVLCRDGEVLAAVTYVGLARDAAFKPFRSMQLVDDHAALAVARQVLAALHWTGLANVDLRRDAAGQPHLLEINPRTWGNLRGAVAAGLNFADLWCRTAFGEVATRPTPSAGRYIATIDTLALLRDRLRPGIAAPPLPAWRESGLRFVCRDPWLHLCAFVRHRGAGGWPALWHHLRRHPAPPVEAPPLACFSSSPR
jgi:hypothetical protein